MAHDNWTETWFGLAAVVVAMGFGFIFGLIVMHQDRDKFRDALTTTRKQAVERGCMEVWQDGKRTLYKWTPTPHKGQTP